MKDRFRRAAAAVSNAAGSAWAFMLALLVVVIWAVSGPAFNFSPTWQLVINTGTTIVTFLMIFLVQNTQNRDGKAMQLKLDELIRATRASDTFIDIEDLSDEDLSYISKEFRRLHESSENPALIKFHKKLESVHQKRKSSSKSESVANQVVGILNPFSDHNQEKFKK